MLLKINILRKYCNVIEKYILYVKIMIKLVGIKIMIY